MQRCSNWRIHTAPMSASTTCSSSSDGGPEGGRPSISTDGIRSGRINRRRYRRLALLGGAGLLPLTCARLPKGHTAPTARLEANIRRITGSVNGTWDIYIQCLETGEEVALAA